MNLVEAAEELTYVPTEQLTQMISDPNSRHPSFLVLSEVQRRNQMKRSYDAQVAAQNKPDTTVAQEAVAELTGGLAGASSNQQLSSPNMGESPVGGGVPASSGLRGMQMMAGGGRTGYQNRGLLEQALGYDPNLKNLRNRPEFGAGLNELMDFANKPELGLGAYNIQMSRTRPIGPLNYGGNVLTGLQAERDQKEAAIEAIRKKANELGVPIGSVQDVFSLDPTEKGQKFPTFVPQNKDFSAGFLPPETNTDNLFAGTGLSPSPIFNDKYNAEEDELAGNIVNMKKEEGSKGGISEALDIVENFRKNRREFEVEDIRTDTSSLQKLLDLVPNVDRSKYEIDYKAPTPEERARDRQVTMLSGLAQIVGGAKNLGEVGAGVGKLGQDIQDMRKEARKEDIDLQTKRVQNEVAIDAIARGNREERRLIADTIMKASQQDNIANVNNQIQLFVAQSNLDRTELQSAISLIRDETQRSLIKRYGVRDDIDLYEALSTEKNRLLQDFQETNFSLNDLERADKMQKIRDIDNQMNNLYRKVVPTSDTDVPQTNVSDPAGIR